MPAGPDEQRELLRRVEIVAGLDRVSLARLVTHLDPVAVPRGTTVCEQGDPADALYIIARGEFGVFAQDDDGPERRINELRPGDQFGEMALLTDGSPHSHVPPHPGRHRPMARVRERVNNAVPIHSTRRHKGFCDSHGRRVAHPGHREDSVSPTRAGLGDAVEIRRAIGATH